MKRILCLLAAILALAATAQEVDSLASAFYRHAELRQYQQAVETGNKLLPLLIDDKERATVMDTLAFCHGVLCNFPKAVELWTQALETRKRTLDENHPDYATSLNDLAKRYEGVADEAKVAELYAQAIDVYKQIHGEDTPDYLHSFDYLADYYSDLGDNAKALELGTRALEIRKRTYGENHPDYATSLEYLANYYSKISDFPKAIELETQALEIHKCTLGEEHPDYAYSLDKLATYYSLLGDHTKAIELATQASDIRKRFGRNYSRYVMSLIEWAQDYSEIGDFAKAIELGTQALEISKRTYRENDINYATSLRSLANLYSNIGNYAKAIEMETQALEIYKRIFGIYHPSYAPLLLYLADYYSDLGDYAKALELGTQALDLRKLKKNSEYAKILVFLASCYCYLGHYAKAMELETQALDIFKRESQKDDYDYTLGNLANSYYGLGDYAKAIELGTQAWDKTFEKYPFYAIPFDNMASYYYANGDFAKAIELGTQALDIHKRNDGEYRPFYAKLLSNLAKYHLALGDNAKAMELGTQALDLYKRTLGVKHPSYATTLDILANVHSELDNYAKAIELGTQALVIRKRTLGEDHPDYALSMSNLSHYYYNLGDYAKAIDLYRSSLNISQNNLLKNLSELPTRERASLWNKESYAFQTQYPQLVSMSQTNEFVGDLYDKSCLFAKGLLLAAETDMRQLILESGDEVAVSKFEQLQTTRRWLNKLYELPIAERHVNTDSLENVAERLEGELVRMSKAYGDFMGNMKLTWRDVQKKLGDKDIAVEFLSFPVSKDSTQYIALTVKKGYDAPRLTKLFSEQELDAIETSFYTEKDLSDLVWGGLADELEGVEKIYFSPSGELYNIAIESVPHWSGEGMMSERYNLYRLSSTRELAIARDETSSKGAVVYGGIKYDSDVADMGTPRNDAESLYAARGLDLTSRNALRNIYWGELEGTKVEADKVSEILKISKVPTSELTGAGATETTVKDLSGQKRRILHIATHGFYWDEEDAEYIRERDNLRFLVTGENGSRHIEDKALTRSGLIFAGAQNTFNGTEIPAGVDDGVLTAQEIAQLDLRGLDLLVLSACQTGLGDVKGDGVFGLQRGFKKAGARTILMSLREVDDAATRDMMIQFYNAYVTGGRSKRDAFLAAQQYLKDHDADYGYDSSTERAYRPHWAAFILLDPM